MDVFSVKKKVFLGGAAVTAVMLLVMSAAWACSPYASHRVNIDAGPPGTALVIEGARYELEYGPITVQWTNGSAFGIVLDTPVVEYTHTETEDSRRTGSPVEHRYHKFTSNVTVPRDKTSGYIFVMQPNGIQNLVFTVQAAPPAAVTTTTQPATVTTLGNTAPGGTTTPDVSPSPTPTPTPQSGAKSGAAAPDVQRGVVPGAPGLTVEGGGATATDPGMPQPRAVAQTEVSPELAPWIGPSELDMQTLWSGLESDGSTAAALTGPTERSDDPSRLGAALLTLGVLLLLAGGLVAAPRRRALRRIR